MIGGLSWYVYALIILVAAVIAYLCVPLSIKLSVKLKAIDQPDKRRINATPTPRLGGIALFVGVAVTVGVLGLVAFFANDAITIKSLHSNINYPLVFLAALIMFTVGFLDDLFDFHASIKFAGQVVAACVATAGGILITRFGAPFISQTIELGWLAYPITILYLVAFVNIINLIDGLDGLAAGIVSISAIALVVLSLSRGAIDAAILGLALIGACFAFLRFNFHPAKVFMGDCGAQFLGFALGIVSLLSIARSPAVVSLLVPVVIAGIPVLDTLAAIIRRIHAKKPIYKADNEHIHHRFLDFGFGQRTSVLVMYAISALLALCSCLLVGYTGPIRIVVTIIIIAIVALLIWFLGLPKSVLRHYYYQRASKKGEDASEDADDEGTVASSSGAEAPSSPEADTLSSEAEE